ncbi:MAG: hypothetical protein HGB11_14120, partial [Chlorobiales bacterium]|nr:hypothetical protein [Chlorobiales bacterium]
ENVMRNEHLLGCTYTPKVLEKACRVGAFAALVLSCILKDSLTCHWVSDNDSITKQPTKRDNADQQKYAGYLMKTLLEKNIDARTIVNLSYACPKSWGEDNFEIEAFLSLSDLFSGAIDEYYKIHHNDNFEGKILDYSKMKQKTADIISSQTGIPHYVYTLQRNINGKIGCARLGFIRTSN